MLLHVANGDEEPTRKKSRAEKRREARMASNNTNAERKITDAGVPTSQMF